jgi:alkylation response protein AidB-like acyl-CoA dehydrogenase
MTGDTEFNEVYLDDVRVPDHDRIGEVGEGWNVAVTTLMSERSAIGGAIAQHATGPLERLRQIVRERHAGDAVVRDRVTRLWIDTELLRLTDARARAAAEAGVVGAEGSVAKLFGCELNQRVTNAIIDLASTDGMLAGDDVDRFLRARANTIEGGTSEVMRNVLGERSLGFPAEPRVDRGQTWAETRNRLADGGGA